MKRTRPAPERRPDESLQDAARRCAIDAVYFERDAGGTMHTAGAAAADAVLALLSEDLDAMTDRAEKAIVVTHVAEQKAYLSGEIEASTWRPRAYAAAAVRAACELGRGGTPPAS